MRPTVSFHAPPGFSEEKFKGPKYGGLNGQKQYRKDELSESEDEEGLDNELEKAIAEARNKVEIELNPEQKRRMVKMAMRLNMVASKRRRTEEGEEDQYHRPYDVSGPARVMVNGDAVTGDVLRTELGKKERTIFSLRAQLDFERGWTAQWKRSSGTFHAPPKGRDKVSKRVARRAQRTLQAIDAHLYAIWCLTDDDDSLDGFMNLMNHLVGEGMPLHGVAEQPQHGRLAQRARGARRGGERARERE